MESPRTEEGIRFAASVASDPSLAVRRWKVLSGRKAIGCTPRFPVPEIVHCVGMLPVMSDPGERFPSLEFLLDDRLAAPGPFAGGRLEALDWIEALAERAGELSGRVCTEGALWKSLRAYRERDALVRVLESRRPVFQEFQGAEAVSNLVAAGRFLPVEFHSILLRGILGTVEPEERQDGVEVGDPFLLLAARLFVETTERRHDK